MNDYQSTQTGSGQLKDYYGANAQSTDPLTEALRRRRRKIMESRLGQTENPETEIIDNVANIQQLERGV
jgi:hypothetical protein